MGTSIDPNKIIEYVGGKTNIKSVTHCATRLRFNLADNAQANAAELEKLGILGVADVGTQYQVIVGPGVDSVYDDVVASLGSRYGKGAVADDAPGPEPGLLNAVRFYGNKVFDVISGSFTPIIPAFCGAAIIKAILSICTMAGWLAADSSTYAVLAAASNSIFYFLPSCFASPWRVSWGPIPISPRRWARHCSSRISPRWEATATRAASLVSPWC